MDFGLGTLIGSGISAITGLISGNQQNRTNLQIARETNEAQKELAQYQADRNLELWNLNNEYNTPASQMQRYKDAGLNPNLMYGQGSSGNSSSPAEGYKAPTLVRPTVDYGYIASSAQTLMNGLQQAASIKKTQAETENIYQNTANLQVDNKLKELHAIYQGLVNSKTSDEAKVWKSLLQARVSNLGSSTDLNISNTLTNDALRPLVVQQKQAEIENLALRNKDIKFIVEKLNPLKRQELIHRIANYAAQTELYKMNSWLSETSASLNLEKAVTEQHTRENIDANTSLVNQKKLTEHQTQELLRQRLHIKQYLLDNGVNIESSNLFERWLYGITHHINSFDY